jgi:hypothetical protein
VLRTEYTYETGERLDISSAGWRIRNNVIGGDGDSLLFSAGNWPLFFRSFASGENRWYHTRSRNPFAVYRGLGAPPASMDFTSWQIFTRQDLDSSFSRQPPR